MKTVAYFLCMDSSRDEVAPLVFKKTETLIELTPLDWTVDDYPVLEYKTSDGNRLLYIRTHVVLCQNQIHYQDTLDQLKDAELIGMVNWHGGQNAPDKILAVHSVGDVMSSNYPPSKPLYATNIIRSLEQYKNDAGLDDFKVTTEATHWSGIVYDGDVEWLKDVHAPLVDIEIGSTPESYNNDTAITVIAKSLLDVFKNETLYPTLLYIGGIHFEETITNAVLHPTHPVGLTHILPSRWIDNDQYRGEEGKINVKKCIASIEGGIDGFVMHEKLKKTSKDVIRELAEELNLPLINRKALKTPENTIFYL